MSCGNSSNEVVGCAGGCIESGANSSEVPYGEDINRLCPAFGCVGGQCLSDDTAATLSEHGGMAQGAKIAAIDIFYGDYSYGDLAGNGLWEACEDAGCRIHSNSYGVDLRCQLTALDVLYDEYMYEVSPLSVKGGRWCFVLSLWLCFYGLCSLVLPRAAE